MKKLLVLTAILVGASLAKAEDDFGYQFLYWQIQPGLVDDDVADFNAAYFYTVSINGDRTALGVAAADRTAGSEIKGTVDLRDYANNRFVLELANWDGENATVVGSSGLLSYAALEPFMTTYQFMTDIPTQGLWAPAMHVPEPTSGLLLLLGLGGLALRRQWRFS